MDGKILDTPGEPRDSTLKDRLYHGAYPVQEYHGLVFAYMGPLDQTPDFPIFDTYGLPGYQLVACPGYANTRGEARDLPGSHHRVRGGDRWIAALNGRRGRRGNRGGGCRDRHRECTSTQTIWIHCIARTLTSCSRIMKKGRKPPAKKAHGHG